MNHDLNDERNNSLKMCVKKPKFKASAETSEGLHSNGMMPLVETAGNVREQVAGQTGHAEYIEVTNSIMRNKL